MSGALVEFELAMPGNASWNGKWTGDDRQYLVYRRVTAKRCRELCLPRSWTHSFGDGWVARVSARPVKRGRRSDGFAGYEWMVESILRHAEIRT